MKRFRSGFQAMVFGGVMLSLLGCVSRRDRDRPIPRFRNTTQVPIAIRVEDARTDLRILIERDRENWLYYRQNPEAQAMDLSRLVGNALNAFGATAGYRIVKADTPVEMWEYLIHLTYEEGFSRWPVEVDRNATLVGVEGACEIRYVLYRRGKEIKSGRMKSYPDSFNVPLNIIHRDNVEKMVTESLSHQFNLARRKVLDELMVELAKVWPDYTKRRK